MSKIFNLSEIEVAMAIISENEVIEALLKSKDARIESLSCELEEAEEEAEHFENESLKPTGVLFRILEEKTISEEIKQKYIRIIEDELGIIY